MPSYEVLAVRYATRTATRAEVFHGDDVPDPEGALGMDYFFWLIRDPGGRTIVVDSGFDRAVGERMGRTMLVEPATALWRLGVDPAVVAQVVVTHLHYDHIGNLDLFPAATFVVARADLEFWAQPHDDRPDLELYVQRDEIARVQHARAMGRVRLVEDALDVAPGIRAVRVGGHSPGQLALVVDTADGGVVLASDAVHYYEELDAGRPFAVFADLQGMHDAYAIVRELADDGRRPIVAGHDPLVTARFPAVGGDPGFAVRIVPDSGTALGAAQPGPEDAVVPSHDKEPE